MAASNDEIAVLREELDEFEKKNRELLMKNVELTHQLSYLQKELNRLKEAKLDVN